MAHLSFSMLAMEYLADHRLPGLTELFLVATFAGEVEGYVLIGTLIYVVYDKKLAIRLMVLTSLTMTLNHLLKVGIGNPRPFIQEGDYLQRWAVSPENARELASEYSTPSGHAMAAASFYAFLYGCVRSRAVRIGAVVAVVLIGLSRPYLGVHYVEDILLGWVIGFGIGFAALKHADRIAAAWNRLAYAQRIGIAVAASLVLWVVTLALGGGPNEEPPRAFMGYVGTFTGIVIAYPLELRVVDFDPRSSSLPVRLARFLFAVALTLLVMHLLKMAFGALVDDFSLAGQLLQYVRQALTAIVGIFVAPLIFTRIGLATSRKVAEPALQ